MRDISEIYPELIDAKFSNSDFSIVPKNTIGKFVALKDQIKYKYQIILQGHSGTFPGENYRLLMNSCSFWPEKEKYEAWYHSYLKPNVHYIQIENDLSDFIEKISYLIENDSVAEQIAFNAREFALDNLSPERIYEFCRLILIKYASLQNYKINEIPQGFECRNKVKNFNRAENN